jgi:hypothetical protein
MSGSEPLNSRGGGSHGRGDTGAPRTSESEPNAGSNGLSSGSGSRSGRVTSGAATKPAETAVRNCARMAGASRRLILWAGGLPMLLLGSSVPEEVDRQPKSPGPVRMAGRGWRVSTEVIVHYKMRAPLPKSGRRNACRGSADRPLKSERSAHATRRVADLTLALPREVRFHDGRPRAAPYARLEKPARGAALGRQSMQAVTTRITQTAGGLAVGRP